MCTVTATLAEEGKTVLPRGWAVFRGRAQGMNEEMAAPEFKLGYWQ